MRVCLHMLMRGDEDESRFTYVDREDVVGSLFTYADE